MQNLKRMLLAAALPAFLITTLLMAPGQARACCIYNKTIYPLGVKLKTSYWGNVHWTIHPSNHKCTKGKGGDALLWVFAADEYHVISDTLEIDVDDHGWITTHKKNGHSWRVESKDKHGNVKHRGYMHELKQ